MIIIVLFNYVLTLIFIQIISCNYIVTSLLFFFAFNKNLEFLIEFLFFMLFIRITYSIILIGPKFLVIDESLKFYQSILIKKIKID